MGDYKCNFLWPYDDDSWESYIYEIANAGTEEYREAVWKELRSRIKELEGERDEWIGLSAKATSTNASLIESLDHIKAERDRYREALEEIVVSEYDTPIDEAVIIARTALEGKDD